MDMTSEQKTSKTMNLWANVIRNILLHFRNQKSGHIINTSTVMYYTSNPANGSYSASKYAVIGLSEALVQEVTTQGVG